MKRFLFGCAIAVSGLALPLLSAQDFCCPSQCCDTCCCGDFNGLYVGGNIGVLTHKAYRNDLDGFLIDNSGWTSTATSFTGGVQLGYDWQCCNFLFGVVGDWNWTDAHHKIPNQTQVTSDIFIKNEAHWFSTIRARFGLTLCDALIYVTAGGAVSHFHTHWRDFTNLTGPSFRNNEHRWGWTAGVGTEVLLGCNWSFGADFLFLHFDERRRDFFEGSLGTFAFSHSDSIWVARVLLNYRFGDLFCCW